MKKGCDCEFNSVNYHLWLPCNMRCDYCFATFSDVKEILPKGYLQKSEAILVVRELAKVIGTAGKINFAGGEPTLCPWLVELVSEAKSHGATTSIITNGSRLTEKYLQSFNGQLDWVGLSIDSSEQETHERLGRAEGGTSLPPSQYVALADKIITLGMRLKVNTVITSLNVGEDMNEFIMRLRPERWKVLQVLAIEGQNDSEISSLCISDKAFNDFIERHRRVEASGIKIVPENNEDMTGSYAMVDPAGRFFDNTKGVYTYSSPILQVGIEQAWQEITFSSDRFRNRGGDYHWRRTHEV